MVEENKTKKKKTRTWLGSNQQPLDQQPNALTNCATSARLHISQEARGKIRVMTTFLTAIISPQTKQLQF